MSPFPETSGPGPGSPYEEYSFRYPAWGTSWGLSWENSWGYLFPVLFPETSGTSPEEIYEEN